MRHNRRKHPFYRTFTKQACALLKRTLWTTVLILCISGMTMGQEGRFEYPVFDEVVCTESIPFSSATAQGASSPSTLYLDFYEPEGDTMASRPLVITVFGGAFVTGSRDFVDMREYCNRLSTYGYVAASIDYRLLPFSSLTAEGLIRTGYMAAQDVSSAIRFFKAHGEEYRVDTAAIFLLGNSAGSIAILHEVFMDDDERPAETYNQPDLGGIHDSGYEEYLHYSPNVAGIIPQWGGVTDVDIVDVDETTPICLIHGTDDNTVPYDSGYCYGGYLPNLMPFMYGSHPIAEHLEAIQHPDFELHPFEGEEHAFYFTITYQLDMPKFDSCFSIVRDFLLRQLNTHSQISVEHHEPLISVYPNPAADVLHVIGPIEKEDTFAVIDLSGKYRLSVIATSVGDVSLDVSRLSRGVYLLLYRKKDQIMTVKFEKR